MLEDFLGHEILALVVVVYESQRAVPSRVRDLPGDYGLSQHWVVCERHSVEAMAQLPNEGEECKFRFGSPLPCRSSSTSAEPPRS